MPGRKKTQTTSKRGTSKRTRSIQTREPSETQHHSPNSLKEDVTNPFEKINQEDINPYHQHLQPNPLDPPLALQQAVPAVEIKKRKRGRPPKKPAVPPNAELSKTTIVNTSDPPETQGCQYTKFTALKGHQKPAARKAPTRTSTAEESKSAKTTVETNPSLTAISTFDKADFTFNQDRNIEALLNKRLNDSAKKRVRRATAVIFEPRVRPTGPRTMISSISNPTPAAAPASSPPLPFKTPIRPKNISGSDSDPGSPNPPKTTPPHLIPADRSDAYETPTRKPKNTPTHSALSSSPVKKVALNVHNPFPSRGKLLSPELLRSPQAAKRSVQDHGSPIKKPASDLVSLKKRAVQSIRMVSPSPTKSGRHSLSRSSLKEGGLGDASLPYIPKAPEDRSFTTVDGRLAPYSTVSDDEKVLQRLLDEEGTNQAELGEPNESGELLVPCENKDAVETMMRLSPIIEETSEGIKSPMTHLGLPIIFNEPRGEIDVPVQATREAKKSAGDSFEFPVESENWKVIEESRLDTEEENAEGKEAARSTHTVHFQQAYDHSKLNSRAPRAPTGDFRQLEAMDAFGQVEKLDEKSVPPSTLPKDYSFQPERFSDVNAFRYEDTLQVNTADDDNSAPGLSRGSGGKGELTVAQMLANISNMRESSAMLDFAVASAWNTLQDTIEEFKDVVSRAREKSVAASTESKNGRYEDHYNQDGINQALDGEDKHKKDEPQPKGKAPIKEAPREKAVRQGAKEYPPSLPPFTAGRAENAIASIRNPQASLRAPLPPCFAASSASSSLTITTSISTEKAASGQHTKSIAGKSSRFPNDQHGTGSSLPAPTLPTPTDKYKYITKTFSDGGLHRTDRTHNSRGLLEVRDRLFSDITVLLVAAGFGEEAEARQMRNLNQNGKKHPKYDIIFRFKYSSTRRGWWKIDDLVGGFRREWLKSGGLGGKEGVYILRRLKGSIAEVRNWLERGEEL